MEVNPAAALAIQVVKGILSMGWTFWSVGHVTQSHSRGPPPVTIKTCLLGVLKCQLENRQFRPFWDGARQHQAKTIGNCKREGGRGNRRCWDNRRDGRR